MDSKNQQSLALFLSYVLSPITVSFFILAFLSFFGPTSVIVYPPIYGFSLGMFFLCIYPMIPILYQYHRGAVDLWVSDRKQRTILYLLSIFGYLIYALLCFYLSYHVLFVFSISYFFVAMALLIINLFTKISSHTAGLAGPLTAVTYIYGVITLPLFLLLFLLFWARSVLKAHTFFQLLEGSITAVLITYLVFFFIY